MVMGVDRSDFEKSKRLLQISLKAKRRQLVEIIGQKLSGDNPFYISADGRTKPVS